MSGKLTLIIGTTADYIEIIQDRFPGQVLFLTDARERQKAKETPPPQGFELLCDLTSYEDAMGCLRKHVQKSGVQFSGIACFDCESMYLAARIAEEFRLDYPAPDVIRTCRDKFASKGKWRQAFLPCPGAWRAKDLDDARALLPELKFPVVVKPLSGSGSEYVFKCSGEADYLACLDVIEAGLTRLRKDRDKPLYSREAVSDGISFACAIEEFIEGPEYSCDFVFDGDRLDVIRIARKIPETGITFGTTLAYVVPSILPDPPGIEAFRRQLHAAARALGLKRAVCMMDFIVRDGKAVMIEMTPRPGGDCLPPVIRRSSGFDILEFAVKFAAGAFPAVPPVSEWKQLAGLRLLAEKAVTVKKFNTTLLEKDGRVLEYNLKYGPGHRVVMPPEDYDSRVLGYVVFKPLSPENVEKECREISRLLETERDS